MADRLQFNLVSPEREVFSGPVDQVVVPGAEGDFGVLPNHAPFMATMRPGALVVVDGGERRRVFVMGGFADVTPDGLTVLAEEALDLASVDTASLEQSITDAREDVADAQTDEKREAAQRALDRLEALNEAVSNPAYAA